MSVSSAFQTLCRYFGVDAITESGDRRDRLEALEAEVAHLRREVADLRVDFDGRP